ncbi:lipopolysaccharide assembly protein LapB [Alginatibacterium sediminis]|uniref:Lipopolysaccharide assembly protein B n=1 Tax=Alginatibacterium sediminis TaxID=2164068 RepID=A0A420EG23_9ALTE|nr:lipopolysaccharide assembly protein LapB [Alginatibacterium sediminis]RKF19659.1 lipopolysaccharide assembly protein LapB [Alginatibacterium sediminis]
MYGLLFLLLPIAAAYGWYMGQRSYQNSKKRQANRFSQQYVTGLNLLLNNQSDKAVDLFIEMLQVDEDTIDTHLALGNLFRQRGEVDRAIRIHQNLVARPSIDPDQRILAHLQLAKDYLAAGLLDRAEALFIELLEEEDHRDVALSQLLNIYQQTQEWTKAIAVGKKVSNKVVTDIQRQLAHFHCELAVQVDTLSQEAKTIAYLKKALVLEHKCVRASLHLAQVYNRAQQYESAARMLSGILDQDKDLFSEALDPLETAYLALDLRLELVELLKKAIQNKTGVSVVMRLAHYYEQDGRFEDAKLLLNTELHRQPTMKGFKQLMTYHIREAEPGQAKQSLESLHSMVGEQLKLKPHYRCKRCGFATHSIYWHCPSCKSWGSVKPIRGLDGE